MIRFRNIVLILESARIFELCRMYLGFVSLKSFTFRLCDFLSLLLSRVALQLQLAFFLDQWCTPKHEYLRGGS